jgi:hypothetical protein
MQRPETLARFSLPIYNVLVALTCAETRTQQCSPQLTWNQLHFRFPGPLLGAVPGCLWGSHLHCYRTGCSVCHRGAVPLLAGY